MPRRAPEPARSLREARASVDEARQHVDQAHELLHELEGGASADVAAPPSRHAVRKRMPLDGMPGFEGTVTVARAALMLGTTEEQLRRRLRSGQLLGVPLCGGMGWRLRRDYVEGLVTGAAIARASEPDARTGVATADVYTGSAEAARRTRAKPARSSPTR
jgi:hypothetical protein